MQRLLVLVAAMLFLQGAQANEISLAISDELVDLRLQSDYEKDFLGRFAYLHADNDGIDTDMLSYTFGTVGQMDRFDMLLGLRPYWIDAESESGFGMALGLGGSTVLTGKLSAGAEIFYAPEILTGGDVDDKLDIELKLNYQLIENGALFAGYRDIELDTDAGDIDVYDSYFVGVSLSF